MCDLRAEGSLPDIFLGRSWDSCGDRAQVGAMQGLDARECPDDESQLKQAW